MKIKDIAVLDTHRLHLRDAEGELMYEVDAHGQPDETKPVVAVIYGPGTKQYRKAKADQQNRAIGLLQRKGAKQTPESIAQQTAEFLADITAELHHLDADDDDGEPLAGRDLFVAVYRDPKIGFIADQVHAAVHDWANFSRASRTN